MITNSDKVVHDPFQPTLKIDVTRQVMEILSDGKVTLNLYDGIGQQVKTLFDGNVAAGETYTVRFDGSEFSPGLYFCTLTGDGVNETRKMQLIK